MRELKFRAWDKQTRKMSPEFVLFGEFTLIGGVHAWQDEEAVLAGLKWDMSDKQDSLLRLNDLEVMQYTGLKDKNGKEIYEGDIIAWDYEYDSDYDGDMPIVKRSTGKAVVKDIFDRSRIFSAEEEGKGVEVIGNIYETPELIKHGNNL